MIICNGIFTTLIREREITLEREKSIYTRVNFAAHREFNINENSRARRKRARYNPFAKGCDPGPPCIANLALQLPFTIVLSLA